MDVFSRAKLKCFRHEAGLTQRALASKSGVHYDTINRWEKGRLKGDPNAEKLAKVAAALDVPVNTLMAEDEPAPEDTIGVAARALLNAAYDEMDAAGRSAVTAFAVTLQRGGTYDQATAAARTAAEMAGAPKEPATRSAAYWKRYRKSLHEMLNEADRLHDEAVHRGDLGDRPSEVVEP